MNTETDPVVVRTVPTVSHLVFVEPTQIEPLSHRRPASLPRAQEDDISHLCSQGRDQYFALPAVFVAIGIGLVVDLFLGTVDDQLQTELQNYVRGFAARTSYRMFNTMDPNKPLPTLRFSCFRLVRFPAPGKDGQMPEDTEPVFDFVGQIRQGPGPDAMQIRPLRLYYAEALPKGNPVAVAISLKMETSWVDGTEGRTKLLFDIPLLSTKRNLRAAEKVEYFPPVGMLGLSPASGFRKPEMSPAGASADASAWGAASVLPLPPYSTDADGAPILPGGATTVTATVAEIGDAGFLERLSRTFRAERRDIDSALNEAIKLAVSDTADE